MLLLKKQTSRLLIKPNKCQTEKEGLLCQSRIHYSLPYPIIPKKYKTMNKTVWRLTVLVLLATQVMADETAATEVLNALELGEGFVR